MLGLLRFIPQIGTLLLRLSTWLMQRKWGQWVLFYLGGAFFAILDKVVTWLGVMFVANELGVGNLLPYVSGPLLGMPDPFPQLLALTKIDQAATVLLSAVVAKAVSNIKITRRPGAPGWTTSPGAGG